MSKKTKLSTYALSPYGMKVYWALIFKKVDFSLHYVGFKDQREISFTNQHIVPVVEIDDEWRIDSGPICCWLDEQFPDTLIAGSSDDERYAILADDWVTKNVLGLSWRSIVDDDARFSAYRNCRILADHMDKTYGGVSWWMKLVWYWLLKRRPFVIRDASTVNRDISMAQCRAEIVEQLDERLGSTGFVAGTKTPSYADISMFSILVCTKTLEMEGALVPESSPAIEKFYHNMCSYIDLKGPPELVPGWHPYGMSV